MSALQAYKSNSILTANGNELTIMLYDGAIKFINKAIIHIEKKELIDAHKNIMKAQDIISELEYSLDRRYPIANEILKLYEFIHNLLIEANIEKNKEKLEQANNLIREFRDTWQQLCKKAR